MNPDLHVFLVSMASGILLFAGEIIDTQVFWMFIAGLLVVLTGAAGVMAVLKVLEWRGIE